MTMIGPALDALVWKEAWSLARLFRRPRLGQIAIKVTNHYGEEVLEVVGIPAPFESPT